MRAAFRKTGCATASRRLLTAAVLTVVMVPCTAAAYEVRIVDAATGRPVAGAVVTLGDVAVTTDPTGAFRIDGNGDRMLVRAVGYRRATVDVSNGSAPIALTPFDPRALYLSFYGIGERRLREQALNLIEATDLNGLVIDVKGDNGSLLDRRLLDAPALGVEIASALHRLYPETFRLERTLGLIGARRVVQALRAGEDPRAIAQSWQGPLEGFLRLRARYLLY